jgi:H+-transporting ATPase
MNNATAIKKTSEYRSFSIEETVKALGATPNGLTVSDVQDRLKTFGYNEVTEQKKNPVIEFLLRYWGPMPWLLEMAIILSIVLKHYIEAGIIFALLTINTIIGQVEARGSQKAMAALRERLALKAHTLRDGKWEDIEARELVPGDVFSIGLGDIVPADAKIIDGSMSIDQSALTGESMLVKAQQSDVIYSSSIIRRGSATCVVVNTGENTYFGKTAELVKTARPKSHQEQIMLSIVKYMLFLGIGALVTVSIDAMVISVALVSILTFAVIFLMGAVPVALPAVMTIVQAVGATQLAKKNALVTRLPSIEDAASIDVLCLDKTGTITQNILSVGEIIPFSPFTREDVIITAALASNKHNKDTIDTAVLGFAAAENTDLEIYQQISYIPFEPSTKRSEAVVMKDGKQFRLTKGAPQTILSLSKGLTPAIIDQVNQLLVELSRKGHRTLGVARSAAGETDNLQFTGLISLNDPPRPDSKDMINRAKELGVRPLMLTGDNIAIATEIARQVGIGDKIIRMDEFRVADKARQQKIIGEIDGFAEIYPEDKYEIVKLLQAANHMVGMTGDGVNDAPALKQAEMGIAVSSATDVARAAASVVLTRPGLTAIIDTIKTSRQIYQRMLTWVINKVTKVIQVIGLLTIGFFWFHDTVISLLGMTFLIFANDFVTMSLATDNVAYTPNPNKWNVRNITLASLIIGILLAGEGAIALFTGSKYFHMGIDQLRTFMTLTLIFTSQFRVYMVRERRHFWSSRPGRVLIISTITATILFILLGIYGTFFTTISPYQVLFTLGLSLFFCLVLDFPKYFAFKIFGL